jgi:hypothetical protein
MQIMAQWIQLIAVAYLIYIIPTMVAWDWCWWRQSIAFQSALNWPLLIGGVCMQLVHVLMALLIACKKYSRLRIWVGGLNSFFMPWRRGIACSHWELVALMIATLLISRGVGSGFRQGHRLVTSFICDSCWTWDILWNGPRVTGCV